MIFQAQRKSREGHVCVSMTFLVDGDERHCSCLSLINNSVMSQLRLSLYPTMVIESGLYIGVRNRYYCMWYLYGSILRQACLGLGEEIAG